MNTELYKAIKGIDIQNLSDDEKKELLKIFMVTGNPLVRNCIALMFSKLRYNEAIPYIIKKISEKSLFNNNGTLVYALQALDAQKYFLTFIKIICEQAYEARLMALDLVEKYVASISSRTKKKALKILEDNRVKQDILEDDKYENSSLHFIEETIKLLA